MSYNDLRKGRFSETGREYFLTSVIHHRNPVFNNFHCARILIDILRQSESKHVCRWLCWVVLPDHFHGLLQLNDADQHDLAKIMQFIKGNSAKEINQYRQQEGTVWQTAFHDRALRKEDDRLARARYIVANPLRAGMVRRLSEWPHWDSVWLDDSLSD